MMISSIVLILNIIALIFAEPFMSFWWILGLFVIEILVYIFLMLIYISIIIQLEKTSEDFRGFGEQ